METVNNIAAAASKAIFGETSTAKVSEYETSGTEPVSGQTGDVKSGEPYDKGNLESATAKSAERLSEPTTAAVYPTTDATVDAIIADSKPTTGAEGTGTSGTTTLPIRSDAKPSTTEEYEGNESSKIKEIKEIKEESKNAAKVDTTEPEPKSLMSGLGVPSTEGLQKESHGTGTGEQYVKTTGMQADGGNFDATKPGAGKEADRLLEQKGIQHEPGSTTKKETSSDAIDTTETKEKKSLKEKIKDKLHIHKEKH